MPMASLIAERFLTLIAAGGRDLDWSALGLLAKRDSGLVDAAQFHRPELTGGAVRRERGRFAGAGA